MEEPAIVYSPLKDNFGEWNEVGDNVTLGEVAAKSVSAGSFTVEGRDVLDELSNKVDVAYVDSLSDDINQELSGKANVSHQHTMVYSDPWHKVGEPGEPDFLSPNITGARDVYFRKNRDGLVCINLHRIAATNWCNAFCLPDGYRPQREVRFYGPLMNVPLGSREAMTRCTIATDGNVYLSRSINGGLVDGSCRFDSYHGFFQAAGETTETITV